MVADTNIINQIRDLKAAKQDQLSLSIDDAKRELNLTRRARVLTKSERDNSTSLRDRPDRQQNSNPRKKPTLVFNSKEQKQEAIDNLLSSLKTSQHRLDDIEANDLNVIIDSFRAPFHVGQIGRIDTVPYRTRLNTLYIQQEIRIVGIINDSESIVDVTTGSEAMPGGPPKDYKKTFWLKGVSTVGKVDRDYIEAPPLLIITGTKDYETVLGAKQTVFVFEPLEIPQGF